MIGVLGTDYATYPVVRFAMRNLAYSDHGGYPVLWKIIRNITSNWRTPAPVIVKPQRRLKSKSAPKMPTKIDKCPRAAKTDRESEFLKTSQQPSRHINSPSNSIDGIYLKHITSSITTDEPSVPASDFNSSRDCFISRSTAAMFKVPQFIIPPACDEMSVQTQEPSNSPVKIPPTLNVLSSISPKSRFETNDAQSEGGLITVTKVSSVQTASSLLVASSSKRSIKRTAVEIERPAKRRKLEPQTFNAPVKVNSLIARGKYGRNARFTQLHSTTLQAGSNGIRNLLPTRKLLIPPKYATIISKIQMQNLSQATCVYNPMMISTQRCNAELLVSELIQSSTSRSDPPATQSASDDKTISQALPSLSVLHDNETPPLPNSAHQSDIGTSLPHVSCDPTSPRDPVYTDIPVRDSTEECDVQSWMSGYDDSYYPMSPEWLSSSPIQEVFPTSAPSRNTSPTQSDTYNLESTTGNDPANSIECSDRRLSPQTVSRTSTDLPFNLTRPVRNDVPLTMQSLKDLTGQLLLGRQRARSTDFRQLWTISPLSDGISDAILGRKYFSASFAGQLIAGIRLILIESETSARGNRKLCAFGCVKNGTHQWISNTTYVLRFRYGAD